MTLSSLETVRIALIYKIIVRLDLGRETSEIFFRKVKFWQGDPPPCFVRYDFFSDSDRVSKELTIFTLRNSEFSS